jgi:flagellum-specific peptidoglycan hydrolase FlgJ
MPDGRLRLEIDDEFGDYDSLDASCQDYAWLITHGEPYGEAWQQYQRDKNLAELIGGVARVYATSPQYAELVQQIAAQSNVLKALAEANLAPATA